MNCQEGTVHMPAVEIDRQRDLKTRIERIPADQLMRFTMENGFSSELLQRVIDERVLHPREVARLEKALEEMQSLS